MSPFMVFCVIMLLLGILLIDIGFSPGMSEVDLYIYDDDDDDDEFFR